MKKGNVSFGLYIILIMILIGLLMVLFISKNKENFWVRPECRGKCHYNILLNYPKLMNKINLEKPLYTVPYGYYDPNLPDHT